MQSFHTMTEEEVLAAYATDKNGLSAAEAEKRLSEKGLNKLDEVKGHGILFKFFAQFKNVMVLVLLAAALVTGVVAVVEHSPQEFIDVGIILAIVVINAVIGVIQEAKAEQALDALKKMSQPFSKVRRGGEIIKIESSKIAEGDIVILEAGDMVPADIRLIATASLKCEESALTGESAAVEKSLGVAPQEATLGDRHNMVYASSTVTYGRGEGVAVATGMRAETGKIAGMLSETKNEATPMQKRLDKTGKFISIGVLIIAALIFIVGLLTAIPFREGSAVDSIIDSFMTAVAIAVAAIPEGLTAVITIIMALGVQRMSRRNAIVKRLPAVETLGSTQVICSDKTGTLTMNRMTVKETFVPCGDEDMLIRCMVLCNDSSVRREEGKFLTGGDPTETALVDYGHLKGTDKDALEKENPRVDEIPFDSERKLMTTVNEYKGRTVFVKGAPDCLLTRCTRIAGKSGVREMTDADRKAVADANKGLATKALRVLAYAYKPDDGGAYESELIFLGLTGMIDPPREEVKDAVRTCRKAGITPVMITGDHADTALAIARELGIAGERDVAVTGAELSAMSDEELFDRVETCRVYARVNPEHKVRIVKAWKAHGKIVAMTGDGVNDAPSIKAADIGVGMGITGTDVTKGAADMVLADDNFATIVEAVREGRKIYENMQKTIQYLLAANIAEVLSLFVATVLFAITGEQTVFLLPIQILWINLVTDSLPALALGMEPESEGVMDRPPSKAGGNLFAGRIGINIAVQGCIQAAIVLTVFLSAHYSAWGPQTATTLAFIVLSLVQLFHCFNVKSISGTIFRKDVFRNKFMLLSFLIGAVLTVGLAVIPFTHDVFRLSWLNAAQWFTAIGAALAVIPLVECSKLVINAAARKKHMRADGDAGAKNEIR